MRSSAGGFPGVFEFRTPHSAFRIRAGVALLLGAALWFASCQRRPNYREAAAYAAQIEFQNVRLSAAENFAHQTVHYIAIDVYNRGRRSVQQLDVVLSFRNALGQVVLTERATAVSPRTRPLGPGQKRNFRLGFDPPPDWNVQRPEISIANLVME